MSEQVFRLVVITGSGRGGRFGRAVTGWFSGLARQRADLDVDVLDLAGTPDPGSRLAAADAFVVVTPEYNHSFPAPLKEAVDRHRDEWHAKPVAFVCYGGVSGGLRAVEHLRAVFAELHAVAIRDTISFHGPWNGFDAAGRPADPDGAERAAKVLLDRLTWWAWALHQARTTRPYTA
ncbi:NADPH-dependent FMN reductase [Actinomadura craniellae]|uniref:NADPH-dependent FMN reductase n=1 Tax=Actinomadura craniellae TaxID=2231787 RepID=A0A365H691_9ACTN|nr:NAD(P)H-dependent oxidoreductase [Actinomadura craniellae]RAY14607.1 NADPH-dependent FMN reductase [Actinomadura craniellae]